MKTFTITIFISFFLASSLNSNLYAKSDNEISLNSSRIEFKLTKNSETKFIVSNSVSSINTIDINTPEGTFIQLQIQGYCKNYNIGKPQLPVLNKLIEIPHGASVTVNIVSFEEEIIKLSDIGIYHQIIPCQPSVSKSDNPAELEFHYNKAFYQQDEFNDQSVATVEVLGTMRGVQIGRLTIAPFQYNPVQNTLKVLNNLIVEINFENAARNNTFLSRDLYSPYFEPIFNTLINHQPKSAKDTISKYPIKYVIVSDPMFEDALQPFIEWKTRKGFYVVEAYTNIIGSTTAEIKAYLENLYNSATPADPAPTFVLFVGDVAQIPTFDGTAGSHVSDLYYCEYTGDYFPEVYYGRFSANNLSELQPQIDKTLEYEQYLFPDTSFLNEVVMVSGVDANYASTYGNGQINYGTENYFNVAHGLTSHTYLYPESDAPGASAQIIQNVSDGVGFANYTAHCNSAGWGDPSFTTGDVPGLQNADKYLLMVGNCCLSNKFDEPECFGEAVLRAENKGAIGYIGGTNNTYWDEDYYWGVGAGDIDSFPVYAETTLGAYDRTFHDNGEPESEWHITQGQMVVAGNLAVTEGGSGNILYYWEIYHLMGDPSLMVYFSVPPDLIANYTNIAPIGTTSLTVTTEPNAYVAISLNNVLLDAKLADSSGIAELTFTPVISPCICDVVATKQNRKPFIALLTVIPGNSAYIIYDSLMIDDSAGNNDSLADYSETILLNVTMKNVGNFDADSVSVKLSSNDTSITVTDSTENWGNIPNNTSSTKNGAFGFIVAPFIYDQHNALFTLTARDINDSIWTSTFTVTLNAPELQVSAILVNDSANGNNNGILDAGEQAIITIQTDNIGHSSSPDADGILSTTSTYITIINSSENLGVISANNNASAQYNITVSDSTPTGANANFIYEIFANDYSIVKNFILSVGLEDWETNDFLSYPWETGGNAPWIITSGNVYEGSFSAKSGDISDNQTSELIITLDVLNDDTVSFYKKVSCEKGEWWFGNYFWYDFLEFFIDGVSQAQWDGIDNWSQEQYPVTSGLHTLKWVYSKNGFTSSGEDCAWIDYIILPPYNNAPVFTSIQVTNAITDSIYTYNIAVSDVDGDSLIITCPEKPNWLTFTDYENNTAILTGTPADTGDYQVILAVTDQVAETQQSFIITVKDLTGFRNLLGLGCEFEVYPNPVGSQQSAVCSWQLPANKNLQVCLYNIYGEKLYSTKIAGHKGKTKLNITNIQAGLYFVMLKSDNQIVAIEKLVIY